MTTLVIGPEPDAKGGISSVLGMYREGGLFRHHRFLASTTDGSVLKRVGWFVFFLFRYLWTLLRHPSIDLVHLHVSVKGSLLRKALAFYLARALGRKTLVHFHGARFEVFYENAAPWMRRLLVAVFRAADQVICLNQTCQAHIRAVTGVGAQVLYNPTVLQAPVHQEAQPVQFLFMGRLCRRKGVYDLIEAARQLCPEQARIHLYGDGELDQVRRCIREAGVEDRVTAHGWVSGSEKDRIFRAAQVLVLPSYNEGLPISVLEALAYGMPVVTTPVGGIPDAVEEGVNGYLVSPGNQNALAKRMAVLADSLALRTVMGQSSFDRARHKFDLPKVLESVEALYRNLSSSVKFNPHPVRPL